MKKLVLYILLGSYSISLLKPVIPYFSDAAAHIFWYSKHMATVHYVNGKFHVHKAVIEEEKRNSADKNPYAEKRDQFQNDHLISDIEDLNLAYIILSNPFNLYSPPVSSFYLKTDFLPPKS